MLYVDYKAFSAAASVFNNVSYSISHLHIYHLSAGW